MIVRRILLFLTFCLQLCFCGQALAWHTSWHGIGYQDHFHITRGAAARNELLHDFDDIQRYLPQIDEGSNTESHNISDDSLFNHDELNGGYPIAWWRSAMAFYKNFRLLSFSKGWTL